MLTVAIDNTQLILVHGSVAEQDVEAVVNAANTRMRGGAGIDGVIHSKAGKDLLTELTKVAPRGSRTGEVVVTAGHNMTQPFIFHVAGPIWRNGTNKEPDQLQACYKNCLSEADRRKLTSIAYCSISTGVYSFPLELASNIAVQTVAKYVKDHKETTLRRIIFAMYGTAELGYFEQALTALTDSLDNSLGNV